MKRNHHGKKNPSYRHGMTNTKTFSAWQNMRRRCNYPKFILFHRYGGRGIKVCERWLKFENFLEDMGVCPPKFSLDRIDNDGNYEPGNCRWASRVQQARNSSHNVLLTVNGQTHCISEWAEIAGIGCATLRWRVKRGWPPEQLFQHASFCGRNTECR
jgi:hypothetical protein